MQTKLLSLRMERQFLSRPCTESEYLALYRDTQPGQNVYWNGFGEPPTLSFRAAFDDIAFNRQRQAARALIKGRFAGGNLGWVVREDLAQFVALYRKPLPSPTEAQYAILQLLRRQGPLTIQQIKEETGMLVKEITPILHRLQQAFLVYEDQYDGEWDRGWYIFSEMFPDLAVESLSRADALLQILPRFAYRLVWFTTAMAKSFYQLPEKELRTAAQILVQNGTFTEHNGGYLLASDFERLQSAPVTSLPHLVYALHRNDFLYKSHESILKEIVKPLCDSLPYDHDPLQYLLIDGEFGAVSVGHFRNGPYDLNDVLLFRPEFSSRKEEIIEALRAVNFGKTPLRFSGTPLD